MDRKLRSDLKHLKDGVWTKHVMDYDYHRAMHDPDPDRRRGALGEPLGMDDRTASEFVEVQVRVSEMKEPGSQLILLGLVILLDEAVRLQRLQQAVNSWACDLQPVGQFAHTKPSGSTCQGAKDPSSTIN